MTSQPTNDELFDCFFEAVSLRAAQELSIDVLKHHPPRGIKWGHLGHPDIYSFNAARARSDGISPLVDEAIAAIRDSTGKS